MIVRQHESSQDKEHDLVSVWYRPTDTFLSVQGLHRSFGKRVRVENCIRISRKWETLKHPHK